MGKKLIFFFEAESKHYNEASYSLPEFLLSNDNNRRCTNKDLKVNLEASSVESATKSRLILSTSYMTRERLTENRKLFGKIANTIRNRRIENNLTIKELANKIGVRPETISKYENGKISEENMDITILQRIAAHLGSDKNDYLCEYHKWVITDSQEDIKWFTQNHQEKNIDEAAKKCGTTHTSLYKWREGIGRPTLSTYKYIMKTKGEG